MFTLKQLNDNCEFDFDYARACDTSFAYVTVITSSSKKSFRRVRFKLTINLI